MQSIIPRYQIVLLKSLLQFFPLVYPSLHEDPYAYGHPSECTWCYLQSESFSISFVESSYAVYLWDPLSSWMYLSLQYFNKYFVHKKGEVTGRKDDTFWTASFCKHKVGSDFPKKTWKKNQMARAHSSRHLDFLVLSSWPLGFFCLLNPTFQVYGLHKPSKRHKDRLLACSVVDNNLCQNNLGHFWIYFWLFLWFVDLCDIFFYSFCLGARWRKSPIAGLACGCRQGDLCVQGRRWCQSRGLQ